MQIQYQLDSAYVVCYGQILLYALMGTSSEAPRLIPNIKEMWYV